MDMPACLPFLQYVDMRIQTHSLSPMEDDLTVKKKSYFNRCGNTRLKDKKQISAQIIIY